MQLSSNTSSGVLKSPVKLMFTPILAQQAFNTKCKVTRHQQPYNCNIKSCAFFHSLLFGLGLLLPCLHSPTPRWEGCCAEQQPCSLVFLLISPQLFLTGRIPLHPWQSIGAAVPCVLAQKRTEWRKELALGGHWKKVFKVYTLAWDVCQSQGGAFKSTWDISPFLPNHGPLWLQQLPAHGVWCDPSTWQYKTLAFSASTVRDASGSVLQQRCGLL